MTQDGESARPSVGSINERMKAAADELRAAALENIEKQLAHLSNGNHQGQDRQAVIAAIRQVVLADVDVRVQEKAGQLWSNGKTLLDSIQSKHKEKTQQLEVDLKDTLMRQHVLEAENEKLKQTVAGVAQRFMMYGAPKVGPSGFAGDLSSVASTMASPIQGRAASDLFSPYTCTPGAEKAQDNGALANYPNVPAFPMSPQVTSNAHPFSLAEALLQSPQLLSLASSPAPAPGSPDSSSACDVSANTYTFSFTLRKADGADLGLNVSHHENDKVLRVEGVRPEGAVEAWNRQCSGSSLSNKAVLAGDIITSVNKIITDPKKMLEECRDKQLLKLTVLRQRMQVNAPTSLRAEALEFVPSAPAGAPAAAVAVAAETKDDVAEDAASKPKE